MPLRPAPWRGKSNTKGWPAGRHCSTRYPDPPKPTAHDCCLCCCQTARQRPPGLTAVECRPSARTPPDDSGRPAHSHGSEGRDWSSVPALSRTRGCRPGPRVYGLAAPVFPPPCVLRGRGRIFPAPARGNPHPVCPRDVPEPPLTGRRPPPAATRRSAPVSAYGIANETVRDGRDSTRRRRRPTNGRAGQRQDRRRPETPETVVALLITQRRPAPG
jgi:hypothetical protein